MLKKRRISMHPIHAILFDLDGTLLDTAPDLIFALNQLRHERGLEEIPLEKLRPMISLGSKSMMRHILGITEDHPDFITLRERFFSHYQNHIADLTQFFPEMENVLAHLEKQNIPWGIVTNKLTKHTDQLLKTLRIHHRPACIISGDSLPKHKPDPEPVLHACRLLKIAPENCLFVGDSVIDITAGKAAGTKTLVALYGYIGAGEDPLNWQADGYIKEPIELIDWLLKYPEIAQ